MHFPNCIFKDVYFQSVYFLPDKINSWSFFKVKYSASTHSIRRKTPSLIVWRSEVDRRIRIATCDGRSDLRDEMWPLDENLISASIAKLIWPDCDDMWLLSGKPILRLVLAELTNGHRRPKSGNAFNWISLQGQLDARSVLPACVTQSGFQSTYL